MAKSEYQKDFSVRNSEYKTLKRNFDMQLRVRLNFRVRIEVLTKNLEYGSRLSFQNNNSKIWFRIITMINYLKKGIFLILAFLIVHTQVLRAMKEVLNTIIKPKLFLGF